MSKYILPWEERGRQIYMRYTLDNKLIASISADTHTSIDQFGFLSIRGKYIKKTVWNWVIQSSVFKSTHFGDRHYGQCDTFEEASKTVDDKLVSLGWTLVPKRLANMV